MDHYYTEITFDQIMPSSWTVFPTLENPNTKYKFASWYIQISPDMHVTERETYTFLEWLGDIGGLFDALRYLGAWLVAPMSTFKLKTEVMVSVFSQKIAKKRSRSSKLIDVL